MKWIALFISACGMPVFGQVPYELMELDSTAASSNRYTTDEGVAFNGKLLFPATSQYEGTEPWVTDGTPAGTMLLTDCLPGPRSSTPIFLGEHGGYFYFVTGSSEEQQRLWRTDATPAGTEPVVVLENGSRYHMLADGKIYYTSPSGFGSLDLGSETATHLSDTTLYPRVSIAGMMYCVTDAPARGLWVTDGTPMGTRLLVDDGSVYEVHGIDSGVHVVADTSEHGRELYHLDTTSGDLTLVADTVVETVGSVHSAGRFDSDRLILWVVEDGDYFPWISDGTEAGTFPLADIEVRGFEAIDDQAIVFDGIFYFSGFDPDHGYELWRSDGTAAGTARVLDLIPGSLSSYPERFVEAGSRLCFYARDALYETDGTEAGTRVIQSPIEVLNLHGLGDLLVGLIDGGDDVDVEPHAIDPDSNDPPLLLHDINNHILETFEGLRVASGGRHFFVVQGEGEDYRDLWRTDGRPEGTERVFTRGDLLGVIGGMGRIIVFTGSSGIEVWALDERGQEPTFLGRDTGSSYLLDHFAWWNGSLYYSRGTDIRRVTDDGLEVVSDSIGQAAEWTPFGNYLYFRGRDYNFSRLWRTDGTDEGTERVALASTGPPYALTVWDDRLFYLGYPSADGRQLLVSELDLLGFEILSEMSGAGASYAREQLQLLGDALFFIGSDETAGHELWTSDGTVGGTRRLLDLAPGSASAFEEDSILVPFDGRLFFTAFDLDHGHELWATDGTAPGTVMIADIAPGKISSLPEQLTVMGSRLYFVASDSAGREPWVTDGTTAGTRRLSDIAVGPKSSSPTLVRAQDGLLLFSAIDENATRALWAVREKPYAVITAPQSICAGATGVQALVDQALPGTGFVWTVLGGTIEDGQGTAALTFRPDGLGEVTVSVTITLDGISNTGQRIVGVFDGTPAAPSFLTVENDFCPNTEQVIQIDPIADAEEIQWRVPADARILSGQGTTRLTVQLGETSGEIGVTASNACGDSTESVFPFVIRDQATPASAGADRVLCTPETTLAGNAPLIGTGRWTILSGEGGLLADATDPSSGFTGLPGELYVLEWRISAPPCADTLDHVTLVFAEDTDPADAGRDQAVCGALETDLEGNDPAWGIGIWTVVSGLGGVLEDPYDPDTGFRGLDGEIYVLRWTVRGKPCDISEDEVEIRFDLPPTADAGSDTCTAVGLSTNLAGNDLEGSGRWTILEGPDMSLAQLDDPTRPDAMFTPSALGEYRLRWRGDFSCGVTEDAVWISVVSEHMASLVSLGSPTPVDTEHGASWPGRGMVSGDQLFFPARDWRYGRELWSTDGVETRLEYDIQPGYQIGSGGLDVQILSSSSHPTNFAVAGDKLFFFTNRCHLMVREPSGTIRQLTDRACYAVEDLTVSGESLFYRIQRERFGPFELMCSDGTVAGTFVAGDRVAGFPEGSITGLGAFEGRLFFGSDGLWLIDWTEQRAREIRWSTYTTSPRGAMVAHGDHLYFSGNGGLHRTDGTLEGTETVSGTGVAVMYASARFLYFVGWESETGWELFRSDGTDEGTILVRDLTPGPGDTFSSSAGIRFTEAGGKVFVTGANDIVATDGTAEGTHLLQVGTLDSELMAFGDHVYFGASRSASDDFWRSDGTPEGTGEFVVFTNSGGEATPVGVLDGYLYFTGRKDFVIGHELWRTDGTPEGTTFFADIYEETGLTYFEHLASAGDTVASVGTYQVMVGNDNGVGEVDVDWPWQNEGIAVLDGTAYFVAEEIQTGEELWRSDGTEAGTHLVKDISPGTNSSTIRHFTAFEDRLYFFAPIPGSGLELWVTDGTASGTRLAVELTPKSTSLNVTGMMVWNGHLYISTLSPLGVWRSDGTQDGTEMILAYTDVFNGTDFWPVGDRLYLENSGQVWVTDGTAEGTSRFAPETLQHLDYLEGMLGAVGNKILYIGETTEHGAELWVSDGTVAGNYLLADIMPGPEDAGITYAGHLPGRLVFSALTPAGREPMITDGTPEGTYLLADLAPGYMGSDPQMFRELGGRLYFVAGGPRGSELYVTDGYCTSLVEDRVPGPASPLYAQLVTSDEALFALTLSDIPEIVRIAATHVDIADPLLRAYLLDIYDQDGNDRLSQAEAETVVALDISGLGIRSLRGIEGLPSLVALDASSNLIEDLGPVVRHGRLGSGSSHEIDLRENLVSAERCGQVDTLRERVGRSGAVLLLEPQSGIPGYPEYDQWPGFDILAFIGGTILPPDSLGCGGAR